MVARFSALSRTLILEAGLEPTQSEDDDTGAEHLLLACVSSEAPDLRRFFRAQGISRSDVLAAMSNSVDEHVEFDDDDVQALRTLGIDAPELLRKLEEQFGPEALAATPVSGRRGPRRFSARMGSSTTAAIGQALLEASALGSSKIEPAHILLGLLRTATGNTATLVDALALDYDTARTALFPRDNAGDP